MDFKLSDYQTKCIENVTEKLDAGAKHVSVVMSAGTGRSITSLFLADKLQKENNSTVAMVYKYKVLQMQTIDRARMLGIEDLDYYSLNELIRAPRNCNSDDRETLQSYDYIIFHDLAVTERVQIAEKLTGFDCKTISLISLGQELMGEVANQTLDQQLMRTAEKQTPVIGVYVTNEVLDIRDAKYAGKTEIDYVYRINQKTTNGLLSEKAQIIDEQEALKRTATRIQAYMSALNQIQDQQGTKDQDDLAKQNAQLQIDEKNKEIDELKAKLADCQKQIEEKDIRIIQQNQMLAFQQEILSGFGIDADIIKDSFEQIQQVRVSLRNALENKEESIKECALKQLQDKVADIVSRLTQKAISKKDEKYFEGQLRSKLTDEVWEKLDEKSKTFLITAKSNFASMTKMENRDSLDYSGVCLLVTKALEVEVTKRFFTCYKTFLMRKYSSVSQWPYALRQRNYGQVTTSIINDNEFTLGSVVSVMGMKRNYDSNGNIVSYSINHGGTYNEFIRYAQRELFKFSDRRKVEAALEKDYRFVEKVRLDYRNPSAHRDRLTITSARLCLEYVIDVQRMLKEMLSEMKI